MYSLTNSELKNIQKIVNKELKKNSTFAADEYVTYKFKPLKISRDKLSDIFLSGKANISAEILDKLIFSYSGKYYLTLKNDKIFGMYQECIFECSNFDKKFICSTALFGAYVFKNIISFSLIFNFKDRILPLLYYYSFVFYN